MNGTELRVQNSELRRLGLDAGVRETKNTESHGF